MAAVTETTAAQERSDSETDDTERSSRWPSIELVLAVSAVAWGALANSNKLLDNSFFTHLATGRLILEQGSVPSSDPYSFTAPGVDWTVQSWLPSIIYAAAERAGGVAGLRVIGMVLGGVAGWLVWRLSKRCTSLLPRLALLFGTLSITTSLWGMRPFMFGVIALGLTWLIAVDRMLPAWSLIPLFWIWANSHGSFVLGVGLLVLLAIGAWLDGDADRRAVLRTLGFGALGSMTGAIGPLGYHALTFPLTALQRSDDLRQIQEWQPADMADLYERLYLVLVLAMVASLLRRPSWGAALPAVCFMVAGMVAQRNLAMAAVVFVPVIAEGAGRFGELRTTDRRSFAAVTAAILIVFALFVGGVMVARPLSGLGGYPEEPVALLGPGARVAAPDFVGNMFEVLDGPGTKVFMDDRVDMFPRDFFADNNVLVEGGPRWSTVLDAHDIDFVLWQRARPLASLLTLDEGWKVMYSDERWALACRRGSCP